MTLPVDHPKIQASTYEMIICLAVEFASEIIERSTDLRSKVWKQNTQRESQCFCLMRSRESFWITKKATTLDYCYSLLGSKGRG